MQTLIKRMFEAAGNRAWAQLIAATLVGALLPISIRAKVHSAQPLPLSTMMSGFGLVGFIAGCGLVIKDIADKKIVQRTEAGLPTGRWRVLRAINIVFLVVFAAIALCMTMSIFLT